MTKQQLRKQFLDRRNQLSKAEVENWSLMIFERFFINFEPKNKKIHVFLPIFEKNEINTFLLIEQLFAKTSCQIISSKSDFKTSQMEHFLIDENTHFEKDQYNIPTPTNGKKANIDELDIVFVPMLCFDEQGHRVGYGKGFYDIFLAQCSKKTLKIGLSFFEPISQISDINTHDIILDYCITPNNIYHFKK
ncbi:MAG: 5-formyltetrahydrofolate cyclo-ligase [Bacteroidia bacterium]